MGVVFTTGGRLLGKTSLAGARKAHELRGLLQAASEDLQQVSISKSVDPRKGRPITIQQKSA
eukprot:4872553-Amphidinium_carterae.1